MFFSKEKIQSLVSAGEIQITPYDPSLLKEGSYTFTLGNRGKILKSHESLDSRLNPEFENFELSQEGYELKPGSFVLMYTNEKVTLNGKYLCLLGTRSTIAQMGLDVAQSSSIAEPSTNNCFILEITNNRPLPVRLFPGTKIAKGIFAQII